jgi:hypothetical protein
MDNSGSIGMTDKMTVYLAGPIDGVPGAESSGWREKIKEAIPDINFLDPLRRKWTGFDYELGQWKTPEGSSDVTVYTEIVEYDKEDISKSNVVVVYHDRPSVGTSMEILYAFDRGIYVLTIGCTGKPLSPWILYHSSKVVGTVDEAIETLRELADQFEVYKIDDWGDEI